jgi:hypothetical protein
MEFYTYWKEEALWDVLEKAGMLSKREQLPTVCLLFVLRPKGYRPHNGQVRLTVGGRPTQQLWFHEVPLWEQEPREWWELIPPLMTLYPLCHHALSPRDAVRHAAAVIETQEPAVAERSDLLTILGCSESWPTRAWMSGPSSGGKRCVSRSSFRNWRKRSLWSATGRPSCESSAPGSGRSPRRTSSKRWNRSMI